MTLPTPSPDHVLVWVVALDTVHTDEWPRLAALLDPAEQARGARYIFDLHRRQHVAAHALKRLLLSTLVARPPEAWRFDVAPGGKPQVAGGGGPGFSLSHCDGLVACAAGLRGSIGVDVEPRAREAPLELAPMLLSSEERARLSSMPAEQRNTAFLQLWTLKEAFAKATGRGLARCLSDVSFRLDPVKASFLHPWPGPVGNWQFVHRTVARDYLLSLACFAGVHPPSVAIREVDFEELLSRIPR